MAPSIWDSNVAMNFVLGEGATLPTRGSPKSAAVDIYASAATVIPAGATGLVKTGLSWEVTDATVPVYGQLATRSSTAKRAVIVTGGVIDEDYRGEILVCLLNAGTTEFEVKQGDRIAQLILFPIVRPDVLVAKSLSETARGTGGFGSTGR
jgi:dUTP pyrophosphatase